MPSNPPFQNKRFELSKKTLIENIPFMNLLRKGPFQVEKLSVIYLFFGLAIAIFDLYHLKCLPSNDAVVRGRGLPILKQLVANVRAKNSELKDFFCTCAFISDLQDHWAGVFAAHENL